MRPQLCREPWVPWLCYVLLFRVCRLVSDSSGVVQWVMACTLRKAGVALCQSYYSLMPLVIFKAPYKHPCLQYANPCLIKGQTRIQMFSTIFLRPSQRSTSEIKLAHGISWLRPKIRPLCFLYHNGQEILFSERCFCYVSSFYFKATMLEFWQRVCFAGDTFPCTGQEHSGMYLGLDD